MVSSQARVAASGSNAGAAAIAGAANSTIAANAANPIKRIPNPQDFSGR
jgi:hypothetical protein